MPQFVTEFDNAADDGAPYAGPIIIACTLEFAELLARTSIRGPNGEPLLVVGELVRRLPADVHGDTKTWVRPA